MNILFEDVGLHLLKPFDFGLCWITSKSDYLNNCLDIYKHILDIFRGSQGSWEEFNGT